MRIEHYGINLGFYKTCLQFNYPVLDEINFNYGLNREHSNEFTVALFKLREKTPSEKANWEVD